MFEGTNYPGGSRVSCIVNSIQVANTRYWIIPVVILGPPLRWRLCNLGLTHWLNRGHLLLRVRSKHYIWAKLWNSWRGRQRRKTKRPALRCDFSVHRHVGCTSDETDSSGFERKKTVQTMSFVLIREEATSRRLLLSKKASAEHRRFFHPITLDTVPGCKSSSRGRTHTAKKCSMRLIIMRKSELFEATKAPIEEAIIRLRTTFAGRILCCMANLLFVGRISKNTALVGHLWSCQ